MTTQAEVKKIIQDFVLITYDIPEKEKKLRAQFLKEAHSLGAICHTQSVYLMPYSDKTFELANALAAKGDAVVWVSQQKDPKKAAQITMSYEQHLQTRCGAIEQRLVIAQQYMAAGKLGIAEKMRERTAKFLGELDKINETYGSEWLEKRLQELHIEYMEVYGLAGK